jgi:creatinine amidohydrolase
MPTAGTTRRSGVLCGAASYWTLAWDALVGEGRALELGRLPGHAGAFETALMRAIRPDLLEHATMPAPAGTTIPSVPPGMRPLIVKPETADGLTGGYGDDPARATAGDGERFLAIITREVARTLAEFAAIEF